MQCQRVCTVKCTTVCLDRACHFAIAGDARALVHRSTAVRPMCFLDSFHFSFIFSPKLSNLPSSSFSPSLSPLRHSRPSPTFSHCHCRRRPISPLPLRSISLSTFVLSHSLSLSIVPPTTNILLSSPPTIGAFLRRCRPFPLRPNLSPPLSSHTHSNLIP